MLSFETRRNHLQKETIAFEKAMVLSQTELRT
jgi:hypothetical protein